MVARRQDFRAALGRSLFFLGVGAALFTAFASAEEPSSVYSTCRNLKKSKQTVNGCVIKNSDGSWSVVDPADGVRDGDCVASGTFIDSAHTVSNFGKLRVVTSSGYSDLDQAYAAGFLEGFVTAARIYDHHSNLKQYFRVMLNESESLELALDWLEQQEVWAGDQVSSHPDDPYWQLLGLVRTQFDGLVAGYQLRAEKEQAKGRGKGEGQRQRQQQRRASRRLAGSAAAVGEVGGGGDEDVAVGWLERRDLVFLNSNGDVYDIIDAFEAGFGGGGGNGTSNGGGEALLLPQAPGGGGGAGGGARRHPRTADVDADPLRMSLKLGLQGKCSALIKVTGDLGDLLLGHSTHDSYTAMTRIYKHYDFSGLANPAVLAPRVSFSSYPGELFSDDDFYLLSSGLAVMETTNHIYVGDIFAPLTPACVLSWQRIRLANWMADSGEAWVRMFGRQNSGTYNNQYMILDTKRFRPHSELQPGLLWVVEQLPGFFRAADVTSELSRGYWPSYNVAYFPDIYVAAGYPDMIDRLSNQGAKKYAFSIRLLQYQIAPRAAIFRRDQGAVDSLEQLQRVMRYNDWQRDPYAEGNPVGAVCGRGDLAGGDTAIAKGCYDSKVTSASLIGRMESEVVGGPTAQNQPPFTWSDPRWAGLPHRGMPDTFDFAFERMSPKDLPTWAECAAAEDKAAVAARATAKATGGQSLLPHRIGAEA